MQFVGFSIYVCVHIIGVQGVHMVYSGERPAQYLALLTRTGDKPNFPKQRRFKLEKEAIILPMLPFS